MLELTKNEFDISVMMNYLKSRKSYEVYFSIDSGNNVASGLLYKQFSNKIIATLYFNYLRIFIKYKKFTKIVKTIEKQGKK